MQPLNAIDAITPAFTRTHEILFQPFRLGRSWKLAACQYFGMIGAFFIPMPLMLLLIPNFVLYRPWPRSFVAVLFTIATAIFFGLYYLGLRMQFVNFEMIVTRATFIGPMWRRYRMRVWPVAGFKALVATVLTLAMAPFIGKSVAAFIDLTVNMPKFTPGTPPDPAIFQSFLAQIMGLEGTIFGAIMIIKVFATVFEDFVLPFYILEDIPLTAALSRGFAVFVADPVQCILYLVLKIILFIVGFMIQYISMLVVMIPVIIVAVIVAIIGVAISGALGGSGGPAHLLGFAAGAIFYVLFLAAIFWYQFGTLGYVTMLIEAYATYFLGGRYPLLGSMLEPGPGAPFTPPPVFPSEEESKDDDGGPPMPMNPAVA